MNDKIEAPFQRDSRKKVGNSLCLIPDASCR